LSRYGGDEFVAVIPGAENAVVLELCERIEKAVCDLQLEVESSGQFASVGVSLGAACYPQQGQTFDQMIVAADKAMYLRKSRRKRKAPATNDPALAPLSQILDDLSIGGRFGLDADPTSSGDGFIVELDETHVITTNSVN